MGDCEVFISWAGGPYLFLGNSVLSLLQDSERTGGESNSGQDRAESTGGGRQGLGTSSFERKAVWLSAGAQTLQTVTLS